MSIGLYQTHFSRSGDVIHPRNCENLGLGTRLAIYEVVRIIHEADGVYFCEWQELRHHE